MAAFSIRVESKEPALGRIRIGEFSESFDLNCSLWSCGDYRQSWATELERLLLGSRSVAVLWTWRCPAPMVGIQRAWSCFKDGHRVIIQERLFVPDAHDADLDGDGELIDRPREKVNEYGNPISQWVTTVDAIEAFLRHDGAI